MLKYTNKQTYFALKYHLLDIKSFKKYFSVLFIKVLYNILHMIYLYVYSILHIAFCMNKQVYEKKHLELYQSSTFLNMFSTYE